MNIILASGRIWESLLKKKDIKPEQLPELAEWAFKTYFGENNAGKRWFVPNVKVEEVLNEFVRPLTPISPIHLIALWRDSASIRRGLGAIEADREIEAVAAYLGKASNPPSPTYTKGDATLHEVSDALGNITPTMVNKIFSSGAQKMRLLTGGVSPEDMADDDLSDLLDRIEICRQETAVEYTQSLRFHGGNIGAFLESQIKASNMTRTEREMITTDEAQCLSVLCELTDEEIIRTLLADIDDEEENIFKSFQNAVSKKMFPRRTGRPRGTKNKETVEAADDDNDEYAGLDAELTTALKEQAVLDQVSQRSKEQE